jgi:hypothetical protein
MTPAGLIPTAPAALRAWPWLPRLLAPGRILVGPLGETLVAREDGGLDHLQQGGRPHAGVGADPLPPPRSAR